MKKVTIGNHTVGDGERCYVIAEAGSNHNGSLEQAKALIRAAADAGADGVKFQTFTASRMYPKESSSVDYLKSLGVDKPIYDLIESMEMPSDWIPLLYDYCRELSIDFLSTPFDERAVDLLGPYVPAFKIASYELTHLPLIRHAASTGKPLILSTGAGAMSDIKEALAVAAAQPTAGVCLMQCTAKYPAPPETVNVRAIETLHDHFDLPVGLSDHSAHHLFAPIAAVACGANLLEKHFTLSRRLPGPDHAFAIEPDELRGMVEAVRSTELVLGSGIKAPQNAEQELANYRRSIYTARDLEANRLLTAEDLIVLRRPGLATEGIAPKLFDRLLGRRLTRPLPAQTLLQSNDVHPPVRRLR